MDARGIVSPGHSGEQPLKVTTASAAFISYKFKSPYDQSRPFLSQVHAKSSSARDTRNEPAGRVGDMEQESTSASAFL
jgi:hypothetical protein